MKQAKQASASLDRATNVMHNAARARKIAAYRFWRSLPKKSFAKVGERFGVSRQRACVLVKEGAREVLR
jgi:hypothetical protein